MTKVERQRLNGIKRLLKFGYTQAQLARMFDCSSVKINQWHRYGCVGSWFAGRVTRTADNSLLRAFADDCDELKLAPGDRMSCTVQHFRRQFAQGRHEHCIARLVGHCAQCRLHAIRVVGANLAQRYAPSVLEWHVARFEFRRRDNLICRRIQRSPWTSCTGERTGPPSPWCWRRAGRYPNPRRAVAD